MPSPESTAKEPTIPEVRQALRRNRLRGGLRMLGYLSATVVGAVGLLLPLADKIAHMTGSGSERYHPVAWNVSAVAIGVAGVAGVVLGWRALDRSDRENTRLKRQLSLLDPSLQSPLQEPQAEETGATVAPDSPVPPPEPADAAAEQPPPISPDQGTIPPSDAPTAQ